MGTLTNFDLGALIEEYGCRYLIETGTGSGSGLLYARNFDFEHIYSIEIMHALAFEVAMKFSSDRRITIVHGKSDRGLREILEEIPEDKPVVYWLDAHFPGADYLKKSYVAETDQLVRLPLEHEIRILTEKRDASRDIILIDDLRIYEDGDFPEGPCPPEAKAPPQLRNLDFLDSLLGKTHDIERIYKGSGYLCAFPKKKLS